MNADNDTLLALLVHDLRSPLVALLYNAQMLVDDSEIPEASRELARDILLSAETLQRTLTNASHIRRQNENQLIVRSVDTQVEAVATKVLQTLQKQAGERQQELRRREGAALGTVRVDREILVAMVEALGEQCLKIAPQRSVVEVEFDVQRDATSAALRVSFFDMRSSDEPPRGQSVNTFFLKMAARALGGELSYERLENGTFRSSLHLAID